MSKDWSRINGPVTVRAFNGSNRVYATLEAAVRAVGQYNIEGLRDRPLGYTYESLYRPRPEYTKTFDYTTYRSHSYHTSVAGGDSHHFYDELGLRIPAWKVQEVYRNLPNVRTEGYRRSYRVRYNPDKDFRNGPVIGIHHAKWHGSYYRPIGTFPERRANAALGADYVELEDLPVRFKARGARTKLPSSWDDISFARRGDSWKHYRHTQYKVKGAGRP